jgi:hypothetical protein
VVVSAEESVRGGVARLDTVTISATGVGCSGSLSRTACEGLWIPSHRAAWGTPIAATTITTAAAANTIVRVRRCHGTEAIGRLLTIAGFGAFAG